MCNTTLTWHKPVEELPTAARLRELAGDALDQGDPYVLAAVDGRSRLSFLQWSERSQIFWEQVGVEVVDMTHRVIKWAVPPTVKQVKVLKSAPLNRYHCSCDIDGSRELYDLKSKIDVFEAGMGGCTPQRLAELRREFVQKCSDLVMNCEGKDERLCSYRGSR